MDTTSSHLIAPAAGLGAGSASGTQTVTGTVHSTLRMLRCTIAADRPEATAGPIDHVTLYHEARAMRSAYVAALAARALKALRRAFVRDDRRARFIGP